MQLNFKPLLWAAFGLLVVACNRPPAKPAEPPAEQVSISGTLVDSSNRPIVGAAILIDGAQVGTTTGTGGFAIKHKADPARLPVSFTAGGYVGTTRIFDLPKTGELATSPTVLLARAAPTVLQAERGGRVTFGDGTLLVPPNAFVDGRGRPVTGPVKVSVTAFDVGDPKAIRRAPGDFRAKTADGSDIRLQSYGMFDLAVTDPAGKALSVAKGVQLPFTVRVPERLARQASKTAGLYSLEPKTGLWVAEGELTQTEPLVYSGAISRTGTWNADNPYEVTCITVRVVRLDFTTQTNVPVDNAQVTATGITYGSVSTGQSNANGLVCLLVKRNEQIQISAWKQVGTSTWMSPTEPVVQTPDVQSDATACGTDVCPLVAEVVVDQLVGMLAPEPGDRR